MRSLVWRVVAAVCIGAIVVLAIDLHEQRQAVYAQSIDYVTALVGGETGRALIEHPLSVTAWRLQVPGARVVVPEAGALASLVKLVLDPASYDHGGVTAGAAHSPRPAEAASVARASTVRFENEQGSLNIMIAADGSVIEILRDGGRISQASMAPVQGRIKAILRLILDRQQAPAAH